jgi:hypothetical protein
MSWERKKGILRYRVQISKAMEVRSRGYWDLWGIRRGPLPSPALHACSGHAVQHL